METWILWLLVFFRAGALLAVFPIFSIQNVPVQFRLALAAMMAYFTLPALAVPPIPLDSILGLVGIIAVEILVGLLMGFAGRMLFYALEMAGALMATEIGLALAQNINPLSASQRPVLTNALYYLAAMLWLALDLHHEFIVGFVRSYEYLPVAAAGINTELVVEVLRRTSGLFVLAVQMAAPVMAVIFIINLVFAALSRAVPQMNVFILSFSARLFAGMAVLGITVALMAQHIVNYLSRLPEDVLRVAWMLGA